MVVVYFLRTSKTSWLSINKYGCFHFIYKCDYVYVFLPYNTNTKVMVSCESNNSSGFFHFAIACDLHKNPVYLFLLRNKVQGTQYGI